MKLFPNYYKNKPSHYINVLFITKDQPDPLSHTIILLIICANSSSPSSISIISSYYSYFQGDLMKNAKPSSYKGFIVVESFVLCILLLASFFAELVKYRWCLCQMNQDQAVGMFYLLLSQIQSQKRATLSESLVLEGWDLELVSSLAKSFLSRGDTLGRRSVFFLSVLFFLLLGVRSFLLILSQF